MLPLSIADARAIALAPVAIDIFFPRYVESAVEGEKKREKNAITSANRRPTPHRSSYLL